MNYYYLVWRVMNPQKLSKTVVTDKVGSREVSEPCRIVVNFCLTA